MLPTMIAKSLTNRQWILQERFWPIHNGWMLAHDYLYHAHDSSCLHVNDEIMTVGANLFSHPENHDNMGLAHFIQWACVRKHTTLDHLKDEVEIIGPPSPTIEKWWSLAMPRFFPENHIWEFMGSCTKSALKNLIYAGLYRYQERCETPEAALSLEKKITEDFHKICLNPKLYRYDLELSAAGVRVITPKGIFDA